MKKMMIGCIAMLLVLAFAGLTMADSPLLNLVSGTDVTGTDVTDTDVTGTDVVAYGNLDGNKTVDAADALIILKAVAEKVKLTEEQAVYADVYLDGKVDAADALYVLKYAVDKVETLPVVPTVTNTDVTPTEA